jgi:hypothetical protein
MFQNRIRKAGVIAREMQRSTDVSLANFQIRRDEPNVPDIKVEINLSGDAFIISTANIEQKITAATTAITRIDRDFQNGIGCLLTIWNGN